MSCEVPYASKPIRAAISLRFSWFGCFSVWCSEDFAAGGCLALTTRPGIPTTVPKAGTSLTTTAFDPTRQPSPNLIGPSTFAPAPTTTLLARVG